MAMALENIHKAFDLSINLINYGCYFYLFDPHKNTYIKWSTLSIWGILLIFKSSIVTVSERNIFFK